MNTYHQLTQEERYWITAQLKCGISRAQIARTMGRHRSTITRKLRRNVTHHDGDYRAEKAHIYATTRRRRCRRGARFSAVDMTRVVRLMRRKWSPEQISGVPSLNLSVLSGAWGRLQKLAKLFDGESGIACDTAHREGVDRIMARESKNTRPVAQDNMFPLTQNDKTSLLQRPDCIKVIDARDLGQA